MDILEAGPRRPFIPDVAFQPRRISTRRDNHGRFTRSGSNPAAAFLNPGTGGGKPRPAQDKVLERLLSIYAQTEYGRQLERRGSAAWGYPGAFPVLPCRLQAADRAGDGRRDRPAALRGAGRLGDHARHDPGRVQVHPHDADRPAHARERRAGHDELRRKHPALRSVRRGQPQPQLPLGRRHGQGRRPRGRVRLQLGHLHQARVDAHAHPLGARRRTRSTPSAAARRRATGSAASSWPTRSARDRT